MLREHDKNREPISIHALREEGDPAKTPSSPRLWRFLSTPSARRATVEPSAYVCCLPNFYPRPPRGGRPRQGPTAPRKGVFLSTPSARRATGVMSLIFKSWKFLSTPSARRATQVAGRLRRNRQISIHALREEGDRACSSAKIAEVQFLSTPSARRATPSTTHPASAQMYFYPRPPRGGRPPSARPSAVMERISIHALREEGDPASRPQNPDQSRFLSTPSARRATRYAIPPPYAMGEISIHALREEGDVSYSCKGPLSGHISIHALREEGDLRKRKDWSTRMISIHALREEGDRKKAFANDIEMISIHALREEGDLKRHGESKSIDKFLSTPSARRAT